MICRYLHIAILVLLPFVTFGAGAAGRDLPEIFLESHLESDEVVEGERLIYEVVLYSQSPEISAVNCLELPDFSTLPHQQSSPDSQLEKIECNGVEYYTVVIDRYFVGFNEKGKYKIKGGQYRIGVAHEENLVVPFWGPTVMQKITPVDLKTTDVAVKVKALSEKNRPENFSGAVGDFQISLYLPEGKIRAGSNGVMMVTVSGIGDLEKSGLPDIASAFHDGLQFKSMTESRTHYVQGGRLGSEMEVEVIFSPKSAGTYKIEGISFNFFNISTGKYETVTADSIEVEVDDSIPSDTSPSEILDI